MNEREIDGALFKNMLTAGLSVLKQNLETVDDLNVFPIPDGDTGDNMFSTLYGGVKMIPDGECSLGTVAKAVGEGVLLGARGNSGVILSQMIYGITEEFALHERADIHTVGFAFVRGVNKAYASVSQPVEGTMLTVLREATAYANGNINGESTLISYFSDFLEEGKKSLDRTPDLLPVLKEAGVIDSGGAGVLCIVKGMLDAVGGQTVELSELAVTTASKDIDFSLFNENSVMLYGYCTEFLLQLTRAKTDIDNFSLEEMKQKLSSFGDSIVAVKTGSVVKIHVHTLTPGAVLEYAQSFGEFLTVKIENMTLQHSEKQEKQNNVFKKNAVRKKFATIAVADGEGIFNVFKELGADLIIDGGQGNNPSVEVFLNAFEAVNSDVIFVLPDNGNIIMAAKEAAEHYKDSDVRVLNSDSFGAGYAALSALDYSSENADEIASAMQSDIDDSVCACVSRAIRDTSANGLDIKSGNYIGFIDKDILLTESRKVEAAKRLAEKAGAAERNFLIAFYGASVTDGERSEFENYINQTFPQAEFYGMDGGQSVYDFVLVLQ